MRQRMENQVVLTCTGLDLSRLTNIEVYLNQDTLFRQYTPKVRSTTEMVVTIPFEDAMRLKKQPVRLQFAFTDENGNRDASNVVRVPVEELLKEAGYDPH